MKRLGLIITFLLLQVAQALAITITDVKVSVTSDSAATAREKALEKAHGLAFQKLLKEHFPESSRPLPPQTLLMNMVTNFSIDREKTTPQSYTASLTFQFDEAQVRNWLQQDTSPKDKSQPSSDPFKKDKPPLKIAISYATFPEWQQIKKSLEHLPGVQKINVVTLSSKKAEVEVTYGGDITQLQHHLRQQELTLIPQGQEWTLSSSPSLPLSKAY